MIACSSDDDSSGGNNPVNQLPEATQTGENTFGCLLDGEAFIPGGGINPLDCVYQFVDGGYYFALQGNRRDSENNRITIAIGTNNLEIMEGQAYNLIEDNEGNAIGLFSFATNQSTTSQYNTGELYITHLDMNNQVVSGTFWFDVIDHNGNLREIREGRFDMEFTQ